MAERATLSVGDTKNVFDNLSRISKRHLLNSRSVCIDGLGTFTVICQARKTGVDTKDEVSPKQITALKVRFTPSYTRNSFEGTTRAMFTGVDFAMYGSKSKSFTSGPNDNSGNGGNDDYDFIDP